MTRTSTLKGIAWMALTGLLFVAVTGIVRHLGTDMCPVQAAFIRYAMGVVIMAPLILRVRWTRIASGRVGMFLTRGVVHGTGVMLWFYAMAHIPIAEVTALGFTAPIFTTIGAALFLGEKVRARRIGAVLMGFAGALIILRPGIAVIDPGAIAQLVAAPLLLLVPALLVWRTPTLVELGWLFATAGFATAGHLTLTQAFRAAEITVTQPVAFLQLVWATLLGYYAFGETPDIFTWIGAAVIVASATYIAHRELKNR